MAAVAPLIWICLGCVATKECLHAAASAAGSFISRINGSFSFLFRTVFAGSACLCVCGCVCECVREEELKQVMQQISGVQVQLH